MVVPRGIDAGIASGMVACIPFVCVYQWEAPCNAFSSRARADTQLSAMSGFVIGSCFSQLSDYLCLHIGLHFMRRNFPTLARVGLGGVRARLFASSSSLLVMTAARLAVLRRSGWHPSRAWALDAWQAWWGHRALQEATFPASIPRL